MSLDAFLLFLSGFALGWAATTWVRRRRVERVTEHDSY